MGIYQDLLKSTPSDDEVADILTNLLAIAANAEDLIMPVERLIEGFNFQRTYEYFFNYSQVQMKQELYQDAFHSFIKSFNMAKEDGTEQSDLPRFKIQEIHTLNSFYQDFN